QAEQDEVVLRKDRVLELRDHGLLVADDAGEQLLALLDAGDQVLAELFLDGAGPVASGDKLASGAGQSGLGHIESVVLASARPLRASHDAAIFPPKYSTRLPPADSVPAPGYGVPPFEEARLGNGRIAT